MENTKLRIDHTVSPMPHTLTYARLFLTSPQQIAININISTTKDVFYILTITKILLYHLWCKMNFPMASWDGGCDVYLVRNVLVVPANSVPIFKGIKIYFSVELKENESYNEIWEVIMDESIMFFVDKFYAYTHINWSSL